ncbi:ferric reductase-like transmembrane domain-containing protein [Cognatishimia sp.]|uniref:ferredoxin reductase family protein n=1 Tax=Cognatishimia sp. TaxID=2211648 RepID=UPI003518080B
MSLRPFGLVLTAAALCTPMIWWPQIAAGRDVIALFSQYLGIWALIAMALLQVIATRWPGVEAIFGGLDRGYILHKWLGIGAMAAILLHDTIDAEMDGLGRETALVEVAETLGEISLYGILILVVITIATFIPYHLWRWTHRLMGFFFMAGAFHYLFILKPFANGDPLGLYTSAFCALGIVAFVYRLLPASMRASKRYTVTEISETGNALAITMAPKSRALKHKAGQFAFLSIEGAEPHPFTISSAPREDGSLRMTVAKLGDYTNRLAHRLNTGTEVKLEGPFGHFERRNTKDPEVWIAAGVGITPFLAWSEALDPTSGPVHLVYCIRDEASAAHLSEVTALANAKPNLTLHIQNSAKDGRASADSILAKTGVSTERLTVAFCGPKPMRVALLEGFRRAGVSGGRFKFEEFEIRTGIGLRRLAAFLFERVVAPKRNA